MPPIVSKRKLLLLVAVHSLEMVDIPTMMMDEIKKSHHHHHHRRQTLTHDG
jgi:hypothetical protein